VYFVRDKKVVGVFVRFRAPLQLDNPNIKAIWCVKEVMERSRIIDLLDFTNSNNILNGLLALRYTVLHNHFNTMGFKTIHGVMPITVPRATKKQRPCVFSLFGTNFGITIATYE
jgi:muramoyltetrapeptide carboxypeptidase